MIYWTPSVLWKNQGGTERRKKGWGRTLIKTGKKYSLIVELKERDKVWGKEMKSVGI